MKIKLTKTELALLRESLPPGAIQQAANDLNLSYSYLWQMLNNGRKRGFYPLEVIAKLNDLAI